MPIALLALAIGAFAIGTTEFVAMGILPDVADYFGVSIPTAGYMISGYAIGVVIGAPLLAAVGARIDRKRLLIALMALFTLGNIASALAPTFDLLLISRFLTALPHGTFFGVGSVVAAALVPVTKRAQAFALMIAGLTVANIVGVPLATIASHHLGWRSTYGMIAAVGVLTLILLIRLVPAQRPQPGASVRSELSALARLQVWMTLLVGAVGFGGMFAAYSYISPMMTEVAGFGAPAVAVILAVYGVGMTVGNLVGGRAADRALLPTMYVCLISMAVTLLLLHALAPFKIAAVVMVFLVAVTGTALVPSLQIRLMDSAKDAPSLAAALNHSALNLANAAGAWLGGLVIAAGYGYTAPNLLGAGLAVAGLVVALASGMMDRRLRRPAPASARAGDGAEQESATTV
ncbi:MFS transporter [Nocardiopsis gilva YIM 90087]|uniref:MFS transporter n=1 Tax=Nocardiopsis gilva YIM 90087 TaxID=1235441 RepID=A0A223S7S7_9ACTN|nr:MFS transporter [Nocardiopsis gilva]ASU84112.1 MFS transporter [Nocardiopsis gilva YIM 90087]